MPLLTLAGITKNWLAAHPKRESAFNAFMGGLQPTNLPPWSSFYPASERLLNDFDASRPLVVDVGCGKGTDLTNFAKALPSQYQDASLILQDLPEIIREAGKSGLPFQIEPMAHSFFDPQPQET